MGKVVAFAPGHISGFFQPVIDKRDFRRTASRGAGVCISHGATATVQLTKHEKQKIIVRVNGRSGSFRVTTRAVQNILGSKMMKAEVDISLDLPVGQGFGMSGASALSATVATAKILGKTQRKAVEAAHESEVYHQTGLGDVIAATTGGFEIRKNPGLVPFGKIIKIRSDANIILGLFPGSISTRNVLTDTTRMDHLRSVGIYCTDQVLRNPSIESIMNYSYHFTKNCGLCPKSIDEALAQINKDDVMGSMCMLGHAVFVNSDSNAIKTILSKQAQVIQTIVDNDGVRILDTSSC